MTLSVAENNTLTKSITLRTSGLPADGGDAPLPAADADASGGESRAADPVKRSMSISEMAESKSSRSRRAPWFLRFLELPFRVRNVQSDVYMEEATAQGMDMAARGAINQTGSYIGSAMIRFAAFEAGGPSNKIHGIKASSLLTVASLIVGLIAAVTMPLMGAIVDHTKYRKALGSVSAFVVVVAVGGQLALNANTWFAVFILEIIGGYFLIMHQVVTMAYLPDLSHDTIEMGHFTARFMMNQYGIQGIFNLVIIGISFPLKFTNLQTAKLAAGVAFAVGGIILGYAWIFLFRERPILRDVPPGANLYTTGFTQLMKTTKNVFRNYRALRWLMIALLFSPEAGAGVILTIAVTFLTFFVKMSVKEIAIVSLTMIFANLPGALISKYMCRWVNPLNSFRLAELGFALTNALLCITVTGSTSKDKNLVYMYGALIGVTFGWMFPSQRTLCVAIIPKGQETEIMGLIMFFGQVLGWLPAFVFTAINERGINMRWGLASVSFFLVTSFLCTLMCGSYEDAVKSVELSSEKYIAEYRRRSDFEGEDVEKGDDERAKTADTAAE
mmetsp:Transcript_4263/g.9456  ORF Transcript_4263/g.9456 Transcript_4263/m.9456 type:complete len:558 (+) Transcript_4263:314-1987(+)